MKTIFFQIPSKMNARDLFIIPGSVFDILKEVSESRIIIVMPKGLLGKFEKYFEEKIGNSDRIILEKIENFRYNGLLQKVFSFFCKYLILTDTMKLLATEGVRTDVPPAGGKSYLYFLKYLNYHIFGHSSWIKNFLVPKLFFKIIKDRPYKYLYDKYNPDLVFLPGIKPVPNLMMLAEAKRRKIKNIQMPANWDHFKYYYPLQSDIVLVQNDPMKEEAINYENYPKGSVKVVGFPRFDFFSKKENLISREGFFKKIGFPIDSKLVLFVSEGVYSLDGGDIVDMILSWIKEGKIDKKTRILLRPYPPYPGNSGEGEKYGKFENDPLVFIDSAKSWDTLENFKNFINLLFHCDIVINTYSTVAVEALVFDKPVINVGFDGYQERPMHQSVRRFVHLSHFKHVTETGGIKTVKSKEELFDEINLYLNNSKENLEKRKLAKDRMCYKIDGNVSKRIADEILNYLYDKTK